MPRAGHCLFTPLTATCNPAFEQSPLPTHGLSERDGSQGNTTGYKAINKVRLGRPGTDTSKAPLVDLQIILDPTGISLPGGVGDVGLANPFSFPFVTIEDVVVLGPTRIGVLNDNNFPFSIGRHVGAATPDDNEFILLDLNESLAVP